MGDDVYRQIGPISTSNYLSYSILSEIKNNKTNSIISLLSTSPVHNIGFQSPSSPTLLFLSSFCTSKISFLVNSFSRCIFSLNHTMMRVLMMMMMFNMMMMMLNMMMIMIHRRRSQQTKHYLMTRKIDEYMNNNQNDD